MDAMSTGATSTAVTDSGGASAAIGGRGMAHVREREAGQHALPLDDLLAAGEPVVLRGLVRDWSLVRAGYLLRAFLRAGAFELAARRNVPAGVVINEYVALAHAFLSPDEAGFVNAVLDRLARELRPEGPAAPS